MKIERVELRQMELPLVSSFETSFGRQDCRELLVVGIFGEGLEGYGEVPVLPFPGYSYETLGTAWHVLKDFLLPLALAKKWAKPIDLAQAMLVVKGHPMAKSGLEGAFWDLYGRQLGQPLTTLLGGEKVKVEVGVSIGIQKDIPTLLNTIEVYLEEGYRRIKIKIKPGWDLRVLEAVRHKFPSIPLMADANSAYSLEELSLLEELDQFELMMIEQPLGHDDIIDHAKLQERLTTPLCLDESILTPEDARKAHELGSCKIVNIKIGRVAGLSWAVGVHDACQSFGMPVWCGGMLETGIGRAHNLALASLPNFRLPGDTSASKRYYREDIVDQPAQLNKDGTIDVPDGPGIGVNPIPELLDKYTVRKEVFRGC